MDRAADYLIRYRLRGALAILLGVMCVHAARADCVRVADGIDPKAANASRGPFLGKALAQTFLARDTVVTRFTIWRSPNVRTNLGLKLYITEVDTVRMRPDPARILQDGPTVRRYDSSPPGGVIRLDFVSNPPLVLPRRGHYAWWVQEENCDQGGAREFIASDRNPYPHGNFWITGRVYTPCVLRGVAEGEESIDLIFRIEYERPVSALQVSVESTQVERCSLRVAWSAPEVGGLLATVYRRAPNRDWIALDEQVADDMGRLSYEDRDVVPGGRYGYRLGVNLCGPEAFVGETWLDVPAAPDLVLESARAETCAPSCGVELAWSNAGGPVGAAVLWRWTAHTDWGPVGPLDVDSDGRFRYRDTEVSPGARYGYKLAVDQCGRDRYFPEIWVEIPAVELALTSVRPNPAADEFRVGFALRDGSAARLELLDLAGRRVLAREVGGLGRGPHVLDLPGTRTLPAGVYLVRLTQGGESRTTRAALIR